MPKPTGSRSMIKFLIIWIGQFLSSVGSGMTAFALGVCAFEKNGTASSVALVTPLSFLPSILLRPVGGLLADGGPSADGSAPDRAAASASLFVLAGLLVVLLTVFAFNLRSIRELSRRDPAAETV